MRYLALGEVLDLYQRVMAQSGGLAGIRDQGALESALAQPQMTFDGEDLYPTVAAKCAALGFALVQNHPFLDGNKRIGHAAMEVMLMLNGFELEAAVDEQEKTILAVASGALDREAFTEWVMAHLRRVSPPPE
jgi:death-on-curing protein